MTYWGDATGDSVVLVALATVCLLAIAIYWRKTFIWASALCASWACLSFASEVPGYGFYKEFDYFEEPHWGWLVFALGVLLSSGSILSVSCKPNKPMQSDRPLADR